MRHLPEKDITTIKNPSEHCLGPVPASDLA
jgi:hypothetical protein